MKFFLNTNVVIEHGSSLKIPNLIKEQIGNIKTPALIYDSILDGQYHFDKTLKNLTACFPNICIKVNDKTGEPTYRYLNELSSYFRQENIDCVIAIGGGSTMDLGKGIAFLLNNAGNALSYKGFPKNVLEPIPLLTCPSLLGSGADVSYNAVFIDEDEGKKLGINSTKNFPNLTVIDAELTMEAPESVVISSAMDTLVHCIDSFGSNKHTPMSRMYSIEGFKNTFNVLLNNNHMDINYRNSLALGSIFGITALMNSGDGPTNGFAYFLGVKHKVPHGLAGAIFLKEVINYNINQGYEDYYKLNIIKGKKEFSLTELMNNFNIIYNNFKIPNLSKYGLSKNDEEDFIEGTMSALAGSFSGNPVNFNVESVRYVYNQLIKE